MCKQFLRILFRSSPSTRTLADRTPENFFRFFLDVGRRCCGEHWFPDRENRIWLPAPMGKRFGYQTLSFGKSSYATASTCLV